MHVGSTCSSKCAILAFKKSLLFKNLKKDSLILTGIKDKFHVLKNDFSLSGLKTFSAHLALVFDRTHF